MELRYARQFSAAYYEGGCTLLTIGGTDRYWILPKGAEPPVPGLDATVISTPVQGLYLAASSAMDLFLQLDALDQVRFTSTSSVNWSLPEVKAALDAGEMTYAGKYSAPDFELLLSSGCSLAVESTMIHHSPDIKEKLEELGIPVLVERSSYESHPLGRLEWIKVYGLLLGREAEAARFFDAQAQKLETLSLPDAQRKTVAFFHINKNGAVVVRKSGDYVSKMIQMAGGDYVFSDLGDGETALSTVTIQMEHFYTAAKDADILIYNSTIDGPLTTIKQLLEKSSLFRDFKAVKAGNVFCTAQNMFQQSSAAASMISQLNTLLTEAAPDDLTFFYKLQ